MVLLGQPGVADHQLAAVEDVVADEAADELPYLLDELLRLPSNCSMVSARPWVRWTLEPFRYRPSLFSWFPGTHRALPDFTMPMTRRSTPGLSGPRSTRSPTKTAVRPSGWTPSS